MGAVALRSRSHPAHRLSTHRHYSELPLVYAAHRVQPLAETAYREAPTHNLDSQHHL